MVEQTTYSPGTLIQGKGNPDIKGIVLGISMGLENVAVVFPNFVGMDTWRIDNTEKTKTK